MPDWKEPGYFSTLPAGRPKSYQEYLKLFESGGAYKEAGEASTVYLFDSESASKIKSELGLIKIILMLRNPADMCHSLWAHNVRAGLEDRDFRTAFEASGRPESLKDKALRDYKFLYYERALYYPQVERYIKEFGVGNVKVIIFESFFKSPKRGFEEVCDFLGISSPPERMEYSTHNAGGGGNVLTKWALRNKYWISWAVRLITSKSVRIKLMKVVHKVNKSGKKRLPNGESGKIDDGMRRWLTMHYVDDIAKVERLIKNDLTHWK